MPKYYFDLFRSPLDEDGHDFADDHAAREEAVRCAKELARNANPARHERVIVTKQDGTVIHEAFLDTDRLSRA
jgi:hypothetical protein